ncbi:MAG TPA: UGSC family (seleno)protein, partial [Chloroflexota bacterium]|nr:UGSC family (seleno)protein [Chloroflexota bacterium]
VDCLFDNSAAFMEQLRRWFAEHLPAVEIRTITPRESWVDDPEMRARVVADGDAAILGVGL